MEATRGRRGREKNADRFSAEALDKRLDDARARQVRDEQVKRLLDDEAEAADEQPAFEGQDETASRQQQRAQERGQTKLHERRLRLLERDDEAIRQALRAGAGIDDIYDGSQPGELDEVVWFLVHELNLTKAIEALSPSPTYIDEETGEEEQRRTTYSPLVLALLGIMSRSLGLSSNPEVQAKLLTDERWMALLGFAAQEVLLARREGVSR